MITTLQSHPQFAPPARFAPPVQAAHIKPYAYVVIDLETRNCDPAVIDAVVARKMEAWEAPANYKDPAKIAALKVEVEAKMRDKSALWDEAPIATITLKSDVEFRLLHCLFAEEPRLVAGATVQGFATERDMLLAFRALTTVAFVLPDAPPPATLTGPAEPTLLVGHNILGFDLPKLRLRSLAHKLQLPRALISDLPVYDMMRKWGRFSHDQRPFVPLAEVITALGLPQHKHILSGAQIPQFIAEGRHDEVISYALCDGLNEEQGFLMMSGQHPQFS